ncbi:MAG: LytR/AlgR family response regulator transcription factor [Bacteroidia bacterium]|jgi:two-component system LytT family response regulator
MKAVIVDDEPASGQALALLLREFVNEVELAGSAGNTQDALELIRRVKPDLIFLDVELDGDSGFDLLEQLPDDGPEVVFTTGYEQYATRAFRTSATDFLMKPVEVEQLRDAVRKVAEKLRVAAAEQRYGVLIRNWHGQGNEQIALSSSEGFVFIKMSDLIYCKGDGAYTYFFLRNDEKITVSKNIGEFEPLLVPRGFFRVHKSYLINLSEMKRYVRGEGGYVVMSNGQSVDVSKRRKEAFLATLTRI